MTYQQKQAALADLVARRRAEPLAGYRCLSSFHGGQYECDFVVPWSKSANNLDAEILILAQDWASETFLEKPFNPLMAELGYDATLPSNRNLHQLLRDHLDLQFEDTFATDVLPFIKPGTMTGRIPRPDLESCARTYALTQIEIVSPRMVICLGKTTTYAALCAALVTKPPRPANGAHPLGPLRYSGAEIYGVTHTGWRGARWQHRWPDEWQFLNRRLVQLRRNSRPLAAVP